MVLCDRVELVKMKQLSWD